MFNLKTISSAALRELESSMHRDHKTRCDMHRQGEDVSRVPRINQTWNNYQAIKDELKRRGMKPRELDPVSLADGNPWDSLANL